MTNSILESKYVKLRSWLSCISDKHGPDSTVSVVKIQEMMKFLDSMESKMDDIILEAFDEAEVNNA